MNTLEPVKLNAAFKELIENGSSVNIYVIASFSNDRYYLFSEAINATRNLVLFNNIVFDSISISNSYFLKEVLSKIKSNELDNALAVSRLDHIDYKFKPIVYEENEFDTLLSVLEEKNEKTIFKH